MITRAMRGVHVARRRDGFSLLEVMIAMVMLTIVVSSLAGLAVVASQRGRRVAGRAYQTGLLTQEVDRAVAVPIESLAVSLGTTKVDTPVTQPWPFARSVSITGRADSLTVSVVIRPLNAQQKPDSAMQSVLRTR